MATRSPVWSVVRLQCWIALLSFLILLPLGREVALSAAMGACIAIVGALFYVIALRKINKSKFGSSAVLCLHFISELAKLTGMSVALVLVLIFFQQADWVFVVGGCLIAHSAYWLGLLIKN